MNKEKIKVYLMEKWKGWRSFILFVVLVFIPIRSSLADWNWVPTGSMNPTIMEGDLVYVNKLAYDLRFPLTLKRLASWNNPKAGDIIVFLSPDNGKRMVKRVIGVPGDKISMLNNRLTVNGKYLEYEKVHAGSIEDLHQPIAIQGEFYEERVGDVTHLAMDLPNLTDSESFSEIIVPKGQYFVMGDNRDNSRDSRAIGFIDRKRVIGKVNFIIGSLNKLEMYQPRYSRFLRFIE